MSCVHMNAPLCALRLQVPCALHPAQSRIYPPISGFPQLQTPRAHQDLLTPVPIGSKWLHLVRQESVPQNHGEVEDATNGRMAFCELDQRMRLVKGCNVQG